MSKLSTIFKEVREDNDATQSDVAKSVNITLGQLKQYEAGTVMPSLITARKLCEFYDLSWKKLGQIIQDNLKDNENKKPQFFIVVRIQLDSYFIKNWTSNLVFWIFFRSTMHLK